MIFPMKMQLHGYLHTVNKEEFGFNRAAHYHIQIDMQKRRTYDSL